MRRVLACVAIAVTSLTALPAAAIIGGAEDEDEDRDEDEDVVDFSRGTRCPRTAACHQDKSSMSHLTPAMHRPARRRIFYYAYLGFVFNDGLLLEQCLGQLALCNY